MARVLAPPEEDPDALELEAEEALDEAADLAEEALEDTSDFNDDTPDAILEAAGASEESAAMATAARASKVKYFIFGL